MMNAALMAELERLAGVYPDLSHAVVWPTNGWENPASPVPDDVWNRALFSKGTRWRWPGGRLLIGGTLAAAEYFDNARPFAPFGLERHDVYAADHARTADLVDGVCEFSRCAELALAAFGLSNLTVEHPRSPHAEDRCIEAIYTVLNPSVVEVLGWRMLQLPYNIFTCLRETLQQSKPDFDLKRFRYWGKEYVKPKGRTSKFNDAIWYAFQKKDWPRVVTVDNVADACDELFTNTKYSTTTWRRANWVKDYLKKTLERMNERLRKASVPCQFGSTTSAAGIDWRHVGEEQAPDHGTVEGQ